MLHIPLSPDLERHLAEIAARVGEEPGELARKALLAYLEDLEDYATAVEAWKEHDPATTISSEEMLRARGVAAGTGVTVPPARARHVGPAG